MEYLELFLLVCFSGIVITIIFGLISVVMTIFVWSTSKSANFGWEDRKVILFGTGILPACFCFLVLLGFWFVFGGEFGGPQSPNNLIIFAVSALMALAIGWPFSYRLCCKLLHISPRKTE